MCWITLAYADVCPAHRPVGLLYYDI